MNMKIALLNPPSPFLLEQKAFAPLGLLYLSSALKSQGFKVEVIDLADKENEIEKAVEDIDAQLVGLSATTPQYPWANRIKQALKKRDPQTKVIIGGAHPSSVPEVCTGDGYDSVVIGEGEDSVLRIARELQKTGKISSNVVKSEYIKDIDTIEYPDREAVDIASYGYKLTGGSAFTVITSRGCPYKCAFCSKDVWSNKVRYHSVEYIIGEIKQIIDKWGIKYFLFLDDSFALNKKRAERLFAAFRPLNIRWRCYVRSDHVTKEFLEKMRDAGCIEVGVGVESASQKILDNVDKGIRIEQHTQVITWCKQLGITANVFLMIGLPGETYDTVMQTKKWFEEVRPEKFGFNIFYPYVGTPIYKHRERYDLQFAGLSDEHSWVKGRKEEYQAFVSTKELTSRDILKLHRELFEYFIELTGWRKDWEGKNKNG
ncbi:MAG: radical SAM protein [Candidatus Omnitrophica bacterium]|nr:radical SAM protein [Candidatus Omnitrophota bacterium]